VVETLGRKQWIWVVVACVLIAGSVGALIGALVARGTEQTVVERFAPNQSLIKSPNAHDIQAILQLVEPAVVSIDATVSGPGSGGQVVEVAGSGMILTTDGEVLTNNHVVAGATTVSVTLFGQTRQLPARVLGTDPTQDMALVQIEGQHNLPVVHLGNSSAMQVGDDVVAVGNALDLPGGPTVTAGIVSAIGRQLTTKSDITDTDIDLSNLLQTDAPINPGNSGGPLVNGRGQVIGMNTVVAQSGAGNAPAENVGFAIAIDTVKSHLAQLRAGGTGGANGGVKETPTRQQAYLGVIVEQVTSSLKNSQHLSVSTGALVQGLDPNGPAQHAGIKVGDVIVSVGGTATPTVTRFVSVLHSHHPGQTVGIGVVRGTDHLIIPVKLTSSPS
jgi:S1-C subfamily serine protease